MRTRQAPNRAARLGLLRRLAVARRGRDVMQQKQRALRHDLERLEALVGDARAEWEETARDAETWWQRAAVVAGERPLDAARESAHGRAEVGLAWRNVLGVVHPSDVFVSLPAADGMPIGGTAALAYAAEAHRRALEAAAQLAAVELAHDRTERELQSTTRRLRAIERRWIPEHERALHELELTLDERDREDAARTRWVIRHVAP